MLNTPSPDLSKRYTSVAIDALAIELQAVSSLDKIAATPEFAQACSLLQQCKGKIAVIGVGKSGHIGRKISATLASVGFPAFFVHAAEALHGDLGMLGKNDISMLLSYSGSSDEITNLLPALRDMQIPVLAITGTPNSALARAATVHLGIHIEREACPHNLAPTASTTAMLVLGDMLAMALLHVSGGTSEDFARSHPAGRLGKRLRLVVDDSMQRHSLPLIKGDASVLETLLIMSSGGLGIAGIVDDEGKLVGIFTDGDFRRTAQNNTDWQNAEISDVMTRDFFTLKTQTKLVNALESFEQKKITAAFVVNNDNRVMGALHMHTILRSGI